LLFDGRCFLQSLQYGALAETVKTIFPLLVEADSLSDSSAGVQRQHEQTLGQFTAV
jgi:hypothetical protein